MSGESSAVRRLLRDFKEVLECPLHNVVASPREDNIFVWHGNVRGSPDSKFTDVPFHFKLTFPMMYPSSAPQVSMYTRLPHPNIVKQSGRPQWRLAIWDCNPEENGWSCGYTVHSILVQLQAFLIAEDMMWGVSQVTMEDAVQEASSLVLEDHPHTGHEPVPAFPTEEELAVAMTCRRNRKLTVSAPRPSQMQSTLKAYLGPASFKLARAMPQEQACASETTPQRIESDSKQAEPAAGDNKSLDVVQKGTQEQDNWQVIGRKPKRKQKTLGKQNIKDKGHDKQLAGEESSHAPAPTNVTAKLNLPLPLGLNNNPYLILTVEKKVKLAKKKTDEVSHTGSQQSSQELASSHSSANSVVIKQLSKTAKKNARRSQKRSGKVLNEAAVGIPSGTVASQNLPPTAHAVVGNSGQAASQSSQASASQGEHEVTWKAVPKKEKAKLNKPERFKEEKSVAALIQDVIQASTYTEITAGVFEEPWYPDADMKMGCFTCLPPDIMTTIFSLLDRKAIAMLGSTCKGLRQTCNDGEVWRLILQRDYCGSQLTASKSSDWRHAYMLQCNNLVGDLQCYFTKASFEDEVLGMPAHFTVNPRTGNIEYIQVQPELLSLTAFRQGVRSTCAKTDGGDVQIVIPAYLDEDHFQRALPLLPSILRTLTPGVQNIRPSHWLDACAKMMNTAVVLLVDKGMAVSQKAISSYCGVHRLLLALAEHYNLWQEAENRLSAFLSKESLRTKEYVPNLGWLIAMLAISPKHKWKDVALTMLLESFDRGVLWACKARESLVQSFKVSETAGGLDKELVDGVFESSKISRGLLAFHSAFLHIVARPPGITLDKVMDQSDSLYGRASDGQIKRMQKAVQRIHNIRSWEEFFQLLDLRPVAPQPIDVFVTKLLRRSWHNSLRKHYHTKKTVFSRVQAKGVSTILLKGETYTAPPAMKGLEVMDVWRWQHEHVQYLDSSLLLYGEAGLIGFVDYEHVRSLGTKRLGAVRHSGDILDNGERRGKQTISVDLALLGNHVTEMYLVVSAWEGARLRDLKQPHVILKDRETGMRLCEYHLEDKEVKQMKHSTCIIMCRLQRQATNTWQVQALGDLLSSGYASQYRPIEAHIEKIRSG